MLIVVFTFEEEAGTFELKIDLSEIRENGFLFLL